jgi:hypothetical protein
VASRAHLPAAATPTLVQQHSAPRTRLQDGIHKPKVFTDGTIRYGLSVSVLNPLIYLWHYLILTEKMPWSLSILL